MKESDSRRTKYPLVKVITVKSKGWHDYYQTKLK